jgi:hypothetical protein
LKIRVSLNKEGTIVHRFEGEKLNVNDGSGNAILTDYKPKLVIQKEEKDGTRQTVAVFTEWSYWEEYK